MTTPALAPAIPLGSFPGARFFKVTVEYSSHPSTCAKIAADCEDDAREAILDLCPRVRQLALAGEVRTVRVAECGRFSAVLTRNLGLHP